MLRDDSRRERRIDERIVQQIVDLLCREFNPDVVCGMCRLKSAHQSHYPRSQRYLEDHGL